MAVTKANRITPVRVPQHNVNAYIRVPGMPPTPLAKALQEWENVTPTTHRVADPETPNEKRTEYRVYFSTEEGQTYIPVTEHIYEVALYTRATKRFTDYLREAKNA